MDLEIQFKDGSTKSSHTEDFDWKESLSGLLLDENIKRPIKSFALTRGARTLASGVFTVVGRLIIN